jgi:hypothetical protein
MSISERDAAVYDAHLVGESLRSIAAELQLSAEWIRQIVQRTRTAHLNKIELDLMVAGKTDEWPCFLVPFQQEDGWRAALHFVQEMVDGLRARGVDFDVVVRQTPAGSAFALIAKEP